LGWLSFLGNGFRSGLGRRVERLLSLKAGAAHVPARAGLKAARTVLPVVLVVVSVLSTAWARPRAFFSEGETAMSVWRSSWRHSLAAIVVTAFWGSASQAPAQEIPKPPEHNPAAVHKEGPEVRGEIRAEEIRVIEAKPGGQPHVITLQAEPGGQAQVITLQEGPAGQAHAVVVQATAQLDPRAREEIQQRRKQLEERLRDLDSRLKDLTSGATPSPEKVREAQEVKEKIEATRRQIEEIVRNMAVEGMMLRGWEIKELKSIAMEHEVANIGAALAAIVLWSPD
jgi:hypothetical protein